MKNILTKKRVLKPIEKCTAISCLNWANKGCSLNKEYNFFTCGKKYVVGLNKEIIKDEKKILKR